MSTADRPSESSRKQQRAEPHGDECEPCTTCAGLLSTRGIRALNSAQGYQHLTGDVCRSRAEEGCPLCSIICDKATKSWGSYQQLTLFSRQGSALRDGLIDNCEIDPTAIPKRVACFRRKGNGWKWMFALVLYVAEGMAACVDLQQLLTVGRDRKQSLQLDPSAPCRN